MPLPVAPEPLTVWWDTVQKRVAVDAQRFLVRSDDEGKSGWDPVWSNDSTGTWICPVRNVLMLRPMVLEDAWWTSGSGRFARYQKSQYTFNGGGSAAFVDEQGGAGTFDNWLRCEGLGLPEDDPGRTVATTASLAANQGVFLAWFAYNGNIQDWVQMECGWGGSDHEAADVALRFYAGGRVEVWFLGRLVATESVSLSVNPGETPAGGSAAQNETVAVVLMPWRRVELLVYGVSTGAGFSVPMPVAEDYGPIVGSRPFWWRVPRGAVKVQFAPLRFPESGTARSLPDSFGTAPLVGASLNSDYSKVIFDAVGLAGGDSLCSGQLLTPAGAAFVPDSVQTAYRVQATLTGDGFLTPQVWAARGQYDPVVDATDDGDEFDATDWVVSLELDVPEEPDGAELRIVVKDPWGLHDAAGPDLAGASSAPLQLRCGSLVLFDGVTEPGEWTASRGGNTENDRVSVRVRDRWKLLERRLFASPLCLDAMYLHEAFALLLKSAGIETAEYDLADVEAEAFWIRPAGSTVATVCEVGDNAAEWLKRLWETYLPTWFMGWRPQPSGAPVFTVSNPLLDVSSRALVYETIEDAVAGLQADGNFGYTEDEARDAAPWHVRRRFQVGALEPAANEVHVLGWDPRRDQPVSYRMTDFESQDPTLARDARPANWLGCPVVYGFADKMIRDGASAQRALTLLFDRLTPRRWAGEMASDLVWDAAAALPIWTGQNVALDSASSSDLFRVLGFSLRSLKEAEAPGLAKRDVSYLLEFVSGQSYDEPPPSQFVAWRDGPDGDFLTVDGGF